MLRLKLLEQEKLTKRTPLLARCSGVDIRSSIRPTDITGILFHQASLEYGLVVETELPEADSEEAADKRKITCDKVSQVGDYEIAVGLYTGVKATMKLHVEALTK